MILFVDSVKALFPSVPFLDKNCATPYGKGQIRKGMGRSGSLNVMDTFSRRLDVADSSRSPEHRKPRGNSEKHE